MSRNFINDGSVVSYLPSIPVSSGSIGLYDGIIGVSINAVTAAQIADANIPTSIKTVSVNTQDVYAVLCTESTDVSKGDLLYLDDTITPLLSGVKKSGTYFAGTALGEKFVDADGLTVVEIAVNKNLSGLEI